MSTEKSETHTHEEAEKENPALKPTSPAPEKLDVASRMTPPEDKDITENKIFAMLAYIGILFLVPLLVAKKSSFARFHTNQGFVLFLCWVGVAVISWIPFLGWLVAGLGSIFLLILSVMGLLGAYKGHMHPLPFIGKIRIY